MSKKLSRVHLSLFTDTRAVFGIILKLYLNEGIFSRVSLLGKNFLGANEALEEHS